MFHHDTNDMIARWDDLKRWQRREAARRLRTLGLSYGEIASLVPVSKGTLSGWCRDLVLTDDQQRRIRAMRPRTDAQMRNGAKRHREAVARRERIRADAAQEARAFLADPFWVAGVVAYWSEGDKRSHGLKFSNSDPDLVRLFIRWARTYLCLDDDRFTIALHLHTGQDEKERVKFWARVSELGEQRFRKTFFKPEGTGHRKNVLYNGTAAIRVQRSGESLHRVLGWIDAVRDPAALIV